MRHEGQHFALLMLEQSKTSEKTMKNAKWKWKKFCTVKFDTRCYVLYQLSLRLNFEIHTSNLLVRDDYLIAKMSFYGVA